MGANFDFGRGWRGWVRSITKKGAPCATWRRGSVPHSLEFDSRRKTLTIIETTSDPWGKPEKLFSMQISDRDPQEIHREIIAFFTIRSVDRE